MSHIHRIMHDQPTHLYRSNGNLIINTLDFCDFQRFKEFNQNNELEESLKNK